MSIVNKKKDSSQKLMSQVFLLKKENLLYQELGHFIGSIFPSIFGRIYNFRRVSQCRVKEDLLDAVI